MKNKFSKNYPLYCLVFYIIAWTLLAINPIDRFTWLLENVVVFIFVPIFILVHFKARLSNISYTLLTIFMILHAIGAHYTYSQTPFFSSMFGIKFQRDNYDRLIHFSFGLLIYPPMRELTGKFIKAKGFWSYSTPWAIVVCFAAIYEIMEWLTAVIVSPEQAAAFTGIYNDIFDTHKDMAIAALGALISAISVSIKNRN